MYKNLDYLFENLSHSKFRSSFKLKKKDIQYIDEKGMETIRKHAYDFINKRLKPKIILNDGRQTPMKGHPVFISQHATGTCCRNCLFKWHKISKDHELTDIEVNYIVNVIMKYIEREYERYQHEVNYN
jgi:hypothetical protein